jgi:hypothetical protein
MGAEILLYLSCEIFLKDKGKIQKKIGKRKSIKNKKQNSKKSKNENEKCSFSLL